MPSIDSTSLRLYVYDEILTRGRVPTLADIAAHFETEPAEARRTLGQVRIGKTILVDPRSGEIWMAGPFSARQTLYRVLGNGITWWANCAWDMFGIAHMVQARVTVHTRCPDCGEQITVSCSPSAPAGADEQLRIHFLVPARDWYADIGFT